MKLSFFFTIITAFLISSCAKEPLSQDFQAQREVESTETEIPPAYLPATWFALDSMPAHEDVAKNKNTQTNSAMEDLSQLDLAVESILQAQSKALSKTALSGRDLLLSESLNLKPSDWVPWRLVAFISELGVSTSGLIGSLLAKGSPSVQVYWERRQPTTLRHPQELSPSIENADLFITAEMTDTELSRQLEPLIRGLSAAHKIQNEAALRKNLKQAVFDFQTIMNQVEDQPQSTWQFSRFRVDLSVSASGFVGLGAVTVGAEAKLRMEWYRTSKKTKPKMASLINANPNIESTVFGPIHGFDQFINDLSVDLSRVTQGLTPGNGFTLDEFQFGIGASIKGDIGIAKGKVKLIGIAYYSRIQKPKSIFNTAAFPESTYLNIITNPRPEPASMKANRTLAFQHELPDQVFRIDRKHLRKGLARAIKMGRYFAERAEKNQKSEWAISKIKPGFDMSLTGSIGIVTVSGDLVTQLVFKNMNF